MKGGDKMSQLEIFFNDLNEEAKEQYLKFMEVDSPDDLNHEYVPIVVLDYIPDGENR